MAIKTLTYSDSIKGWPSFYSFEPEMMIGMNNYFYSFKGGNLYRHNTNIVRNNFYGAQYKSTITGIINDNPSDVKTFKTISLESTHPWDCTIDSDLGSGFIDSDWFTLKEGDYFAYIRRNGIDNNLDLRSGQGLGSVTSVDASVPTATVIEFGFKPDSMISTNDKLYKMNGTLLTLIGSVVSKSGNNIVVNTTGGIVPSNGDFLFYIKNSISESYGTTGYYMEYKLELPISYSTGPVEIYGVGSSLFKSYP